MIVTAPANALMAGIHNASGPELLEPSPALQVFRRYTDEAGVQSRSGSSSAHYKLGTRRLEDGRHVKLELVARVPDRKW